jgi:hypothetical protein
MPYRPPKLTSGRGDNSGHCVASDALASDLERFTPSARYRAIRSTGDGPNMNITEFKTELARLIKKGSTAGLSSDDMADELTEAAEDLPNNGESDERTRKSGRFEDDPVGYVIESHRP